MIDLINNVKNTDKFKDFEVKKETISWYGFILTIILFSCLTLYATYYFYLYIFQDIKIRTTVLLANENTEFKITFKCVYDNGCLVISGCKFPKTITKMKEDEIKEFTFCYNPNWLNNDKMEFFQGFLTYPCTKNCLANGNAEYPEIRNKICNDTCIYSFTKMDNYNRTERINLQCQNLCQNQTKCGNGNQIYVRNKFELIAYYTGHLQMQRKISLKNEVIDEFSRTYISSSIYPYLNKTYLSLLNCNYMFNQRFLSPAPTYIQEEEYYEYDFFIILANIGGFYHVLFAILMILHFFIKKFVDIFTINKKEEPNINMIIESKIDEEVKE